MITAALFPGRYEQGAGALTLLGETATRLGTHALLVCDAYTRQHLMAQLFEGVADRLPVIDEGFGGECSDEEIARLTALAQDEGADMVIGVGGGKALDTAKALAHALHARSLIVPTLASSDAPCSALSVIYHPDGRFKRYQSLSHSPDAVLVDTTLIAHAPPRMLAAGMGDALATWFEAEDSHRTGRANMAGRAAPRAALALARQCHDTLLAFGVDALDCVIQQRVAPPLEYIVEANILLSGIGFESGGLSTAHALQNGLSVLSETRGALHGEKVAFSLQAMLMLSGADPATLDTVYDFCTSVGLPTTLAEIGLADPSEATLRRAVETACTPGESPYSPHCAATPEDLLAALRAADTEGRRRKNRTAA